MWVPKQAYTPLVVVVAVGRLALAEAVVEVAVLDRLLPVVAVAAEAVVGAAAPVSQVALESDGLRSTGRAPVEDPLAYSVRTSHPTMLALGGQKNWVHLCRWS